jgi:hypothetical protein
VPRRNRFLPLARQLFGNRHPHFRSQNRVEGAVVGQALAVLRRVGGEAIVIGDRELGRKEFITRLANASYDLVFRIDPDITLVPTGQTQPQRLDQLLERQTFRATVAGERGEAEPLQGRLRWIDGTIQFSRSGRKGDIQEAPVSVVEVAPTAEGIDPLVLLTTLSVSTLAESLRLDYAEHRRARRPLYLP